MANKFAPQYKQLGLKVPKSNAGPAEKAEIIFNAAAKKLGLEPTTGPQVEQLPEDFRAFPVAAFRLQVIREALVDRRKPDWSSNERKWGPWFWANDPGFLFVGSDCDVSRAAATGGSRLCSFSEEDSDFLAQECISIWSDFCGVPLPKE
jgi:hypothetical protein